MTNSTITQFNSLKVGKPANVAGSLSNTVSPAIGDNTLILGSLTDDQKTKLNNTGVTKATAEVADKIEAGTLIFNSTDNVAQIWNGATWISIIAGGGGGDVVSAANAAGILAGQLVTFSTDGDKLTVNKALSEAGDVLTQDNILVVETAEDDIIAGRALLFSTMGDRQHIVMSDVSFEAKAPGFLSYHQKIKLENNNLRATTSASISNLTYLHFGQDGSENSEGYIFLDSLPATSFQHQTGTDKAGVPYSNVCTTFSGGILNETSSSINAILEINSTQGGFLNAGLTTAQIANLNVTSKDAGLQVYNTETKTLQVYNGSAFISSGGGASIISGAGTLTGITGTPISHVSITTSSKVFVTAAHSTSIATMGTLRVKVEAGKFTVYSTVSGDTSAFSYMIIN